jgi:single-strand DNA-binding protein
MADDRMKKDDLQRNMGGAGDKDQKNYGGGQQSPGRSGQSQGGGQQAGQHGGGQQSGGQFGGQKGMRNVDDDEEDSGAGSAGSKNRGGQNR